MDQMNKYPEEYSRPFFVMMEILAKANVKFFDDKESWLTRNWRYFYIVPFMVIHFISMTVSIGKELMAGRDLYGFFSLPIYIASIQTIFKAILLLCNKRQLEGVIDELGQVWRTDGLSDNQEAVRKANAKELRIGVIAYLRFPFLVCWQFLLLPVVEMVWVSVVRGEPHQMRLPFSADYVVDANSNWVVYTATYVFQIYCLLMIAQVFLGSDFIIIALSAHLSREFLLLREDLASIQPSRLGDHGSILSVVRGHQKLITLARDLDEAINKLMFVNVLSTTLNVSFYGLSALATKGMAVKLTYIIIVIMVLMFILIQCYYGEKLKTASEEIFYAACENLWYEGDVEYQKILYFIMLRSQKPCYLTSLTYAKITLQTFTRVLSTTWSYFSLVNTMYERGK